jgi:hypothetical protein
MPICKKCDTKFPTKVLIDGKKRNLANRTFCLACLPFGQRSYRGSFAFERDLEKGFRTCHRCKTEKPITEFYKTRRPENGKMRWVCCKKCNQEAVLRRRKQLKVLAVEYMGNKCWGCGYDACSQALEFHHIDPSEKEFGIGTGDTKSWARIKEELAKCVMVCSNCHREIHAGIRNLPTNRE